MPITVRKFIVEVRDPDSGDMVPTGLLSSDSLEAINTAKENAIEAIENKGEETVASISEDFFEEIDAAKENAIEAIEDKGEETVSSISSDVIAEIGSAKDSAIEEIEEKGHIYEVPLEEAQAAAEDAAESARLASEAADGAAESARTAIETAQGAVTTANNAVQTANNAVQTASSAAVAAMPDVVTDWLDANITADPATVIDESLSVSGAAADAKAAGDVKNNLAYASESLENGFENVTGNRTLVFKFGRYSTPSSGALNAAVTYVANANYCCAVSPCKKGDVFYAKLSTNTGVIRSYFVCDADMKTLAMSAANAGVNGKVTITSNAAAFIIFNNKFSGLATGYYAYKDASIADKLRDAETSLKNGANSSALSNHISVSTGGHVRLFDGLSVFPMDVYDSNKNAIKTVNGSEFIEIRSSDIVTLLVGYNENISYANSEFYVYFYDKDKNINWTIFDYTDSVSGEKNRITAGNLLAINGMQFSGITDGYYVRFAMVNECKLRLALWDGKRCGFPVGAYSTVFNASGQKVALPEDGSSCIALPKHGNYIIAKPGYTFLRGYTCESTGSNPISAISTSWFPAQVIRLDGMYGSGRAKNIVIVKDYNYSDGTYSKECLAGDVSDYVTVLDFTDTYSWEKPVCYAHRVVLDKANLLTEKFAWEAKATVTDSGGSNTFKPGCIYKGVPYRSTWSYPIYVGWHVTKHTFTNAANDPDSIFYNGSPSNHPGPYYGLVCSSFATLVTGFNYPMTNFGLMKDPNTSWIKVKQPIIGELHTNGYSHCVIPIERYCSAENDDFALKLVEEGSPYSRAKVVFNNVFTTWGGIGSDSNYMDHYNVVCYPNKHAPNYLTPYDVEKSTIKTASTAKPYRGDRSVYTSANDVKINIKDATANRLYYQKFNVTCTRGVPGTFTADGNPAYVDFEPGTTQVVLRSKTTNGTYSGADLENGAVYGVWASLNDAQTVAPSVLEHFEWHDVTQETIEYSVSGGKLVTDSVFWYCIAMAYNYADPYHPDKVSGLVTIPYEAPRKSMDGLNTEVHSDYSKYRENFYLRNASDIRAFFKKGKFGAYTLNATEVSDADDEESDS